MEFHADKAFFKSDTVDVFTKLPIYVFDSTYLPNLSQSSYDKSTQDSLILKAFKKIIQRIPKHPYILLCFTSGFKNLGNQMNSWVTMLKCYQLLPEELKSNLKKIYMIHESWMVRSFTQILTNVLNIKLFKTSSLDGGSYDRMVYCNNLTELSKFIDITKIRISLDVYLFDLQFAQKLIIPYSIKPGSKDYQDYKSLIMDRTMSRLLIEAKNHELVLTKPGNQQKLSVLMDAIERMNYLDLSQWDIYSVGTLFLNVLKTHHTTLIPIDMIELPLQNDYAYTSKIFGEIIEFNDSFDLISKIMELLVTFLENSKTTKHDFKTISKTVTPALCQEKVSIKNNDRLIIGQAFIKNLLEHWNEINRLSTKNQIKSVTTTTIQAVTVPDAPSPRKVSFSKVPIIIPKREARLLPELPDGGLRNASSSSTLSIDSTSSSTGSVSSVSHSETNRSRSVELFQSIDEYGPYQSKEPIKKTDNVDEGAKVLSDVTSSLNRVSQDDLSGTLKSPQKAVTKFSDGYSSIKGKKKVTKLAQLYEQRLKGLKILDELEK